MKYTACFFLLSGLILSGIAHVQFRIVSYLNTWDNFLKSAASVSYSQLTYLNIAFANPDAEGNLTMFTGLHRLYSVASERISFCNMIFHRVDIPITANNKMHNQ